MFFLGGGERMSGVVEFSTTSQNCHVTTLIQVIVVSVVPLIYSDFPIVCPPHGETLCFLVLYFKICRMVSSEGFKSGYNANLKQTKKQLAGD